jgi:hypothetical protein
MIAALSPPLTPTGIAGWTAELVLALVIVPLDIGQRSDGDEVSN